MAYKVWNGSAWQTASNIKVFNGSTFVNATSAKIWNGSSWVQFYPDLAGVVLTDQTAFNLSRSGIGGTAGATYRLRNDGVALRQQNTALVTISGQWLAIAGTTSNYEVQGTVIGSIGGGSLSGPGTGWHNLGTTRDWTLTVTNNYGERNILIEIRLVGSTTVAASAVITIEVDSAP